MVKDWDEIRRQAKALGSDGCTAVADFKVDCCYEHDIAYFTGKDYLGNPITKAEADKNFRLCIQERSWFGRFSPMSWIRWLGVTWFGKGMWEK